MAKYGPQKPSGEAKKQHGDLFTWAGSFAAKLGHSREDVSVAAQGGIFGVFTCVLGIWSRAPADSVLPLMLAITTVVTILMGFVIFGTRARRAHIERPEVSILLQGGAFTIAGLCLLVCACVWVGVEFQQHALTREQLARERETEKKLKLEQEAAANEAKNAAAREAECIAKKTSSVRLAQKRQNTAKTKLGECKNAYTQKLLPFYTLEASCRSAQTEVDLADRAFATASRRVCSTASIKP